MSRRLALVPALVLVVSSAVASADETRAEPQGDQLGLALSVDGGSLVARVRSPGAPWEKARTVKLTPPASVAPLLETARVRVLDLEAKRRVIRVDVPEGPATWTLLVAAPLARGDDAPRVLWSGWLGARGDELADGRENVLLEEPGDGGIRLVVGERRATVNLCGRPALLAARTLDPAAMTLTRPLVRDELGAERASATRLFATHAPAPAPTTPLFRATGASSAVERAFGTLTDGDLETVWSEARAGAGEGELVVLGASASVAVTGFDLIVRPPSSDVEGGAAPRTFLVATRERLFHVTLPEDAWQKPGARYAVRFPEPVRSDCYAVSLEQAYADPRRGEPRVTLAEIAAHTELDGLAPEVLAGALAGGDARAVAASEVLLRLGEPGARASAALYERLDPAGRQLASRVIEAAGCTLESPFQAQRIVATAPRTRDEGAREELEHARDRLRRCGRVASAELRSLVTSADASVRVVAADELVLLAPDEAVAILADGLATADAATRRSFRAALSRALRKERAFAAFEALLEPPAFGARPATARRDVLRAGAPLLPRARGGAAALRELDPGADWRVRFVLLGAHAELAKAGDGLAIGTLRDAFRAPSPYLRARAAEVAAGLEAVAPELLAALDDAEPRVRAAAARALGASAASPPAVDALATRLAADPWTFVRIDAVEALGAIPPSAPADRALARALGDAALDVRLRAVGGLQAHRAIAHADALRALVNGPETPTPLAERALEALGAICDARDVDPWTNLARGALSPKNERAQRLGLAAVKALGHLHPPDLEARLAPLLAEDGQRELRSAARAAVASPGACPAPPP